MGQFMWSDGFALGVGSAERVLDLATQKGDGVRRIQGLAFGAGVLGAGRPEEFVCPTDRLVCLEIGRASCRERVCLAV